MTEIQGPTGRPSHQDVQKYAQEYRHGVDLFQRSLSEYKSAEEIHKKEAFKEVMERALQVLNETAQGMKSRDLLEQNAKIAKDFQAYQNGASAENEKKLEQDLSRAKRLIG